MPPRVEDPPRRLGSEGPAGSRRGAPLPLSALSADGQTGARCDTMRQPNRTP
jgi:hypothetical protein